MSQTCPLGHPSEASDYCSVCGRAMSSARAGPEAAARSTVAERPAELDPAGGPERRAAGPATAVRQCPNCGSLVESRECPNCGHLLDSDAVPTWSEQRWEVVVRPDRQYFDMVEPDGLDFPETRIGSRIPLVGDYVRIGRRSVSRGISPEIDLSGPLEDVAVSHRHAVLMRQPDGSWALVDQGSTNGTFVNLERDPVTPNQPLPLRDGDRVHVGAWTTLSVERQAEPVGYRVDTQASADTRSMARTRQRRLDIRLLGPLELVVAGSVVPLGSHKVRSVLALLALRIGTALTVDDLEWALWGDEPTPTAGKALQGYVSTLRHVLPEGTIETTAQGYRLVGAKDTVDCVRFERRVRRGRDLLAGGHPGAAVAELDRALQMWRGDPLPDLAAGPIGATELPRLTELKATAEEDRNEGRLALGDHEAALPDLSAAVEAQPLRERRWSQLMLALYRCGRQIEALRAFQRLSDILDEEFALLPSEDVVALHRAIALDKPELRWTPAASAGTASTAVATA